ncbi:MAG: phosphatase PAP2 family protein [Frankia sp.]
MATISTHPFDSDSRPASRPRATPASLRGTTAAPDAAPRAILPRWWRELAVTGAIYAAYDTSRGLRHGDVPTADRHGRTLLHWEHNGHIAPEHTLNQFLAHTPALAVMASYYYAALHFVVTPAVLVWLYHRHPAHYRAARTTLAIATILALIGFWLFPTTPPRLLPGSTFHDTLADTHHWGWWAGDGSAPRGFGSLTNQLAAMPSLHVGWALWAGWLIARHARRPAVRALGAAYPVLTTLVVMGTGNHYLLDAVAGATLIAVVAGAVRSLSHAVHPRPARMRSLASRLAVPDEQERHRRHTLELLTVCAVGLVPWTVLLALSLPAEHQVHQWRGTWVGFDAMLIVAMASTAILGWCRHRAVAISALVTAVLLVCDAWFDVSLDAGSPDIWMSAGLALFVELPLTARTPCSRSKAGNRL